MARLYHRKIPQFCETPRHLNSRKKATYIMSLFPVIENGKEYGYIMATCKECMDQMSIDVTGQLALDSQLETPIFELREP